jgi:hypothetical protein
LLSGGKKRTLSFVSGIVIGFTIWTATNSSEFTIAEFTDTEEKAEKARKAMKSAFLWGLAISALIYLVFKNWYVGVGIMLTCIALYLRYELLLQEKGL